MIQPTLIANLISMSVFSILIFIVGKHNLASVWVSKRKLRQALLPVFSIWLTSQIITVAWTFFSEGSIVIHDKLNLLTGSLLGQLFGNAAFEELIYRGIFFLQFFLILKAKTTYQRSIFFSVIISQVIFALIHIPNRLIINQVDNLAMDLAGLFIAGIILTVIFIRTENLAFVIGAHALVNQPFNLIITSFPMEICIYLLMILITIFWKKLVPGN